MAGLVLETLADVQKWGFKQVHVWAVSFGADGPAAQYGSNFTKARIEELETALVHQEKRVLAQLQAVGFDAPNSGSSDVKDSYVYDILEKVEEP